MPRPPVAMCGDSPLYVCEKCARCVDHCKCEPPGALVSINSRQAHEAIRTQIRLIQEQKPRKDA